LIFAVLQPKLSVAEKAAPPILAETVEFQFSPTADALKPDIPAAMAVPLQAIQILTVKVDPSGLTVAEALVNVTVPAQEPPVRDTVTAAGAGEVEGLLLSKGQHPLNRAATRSETPSSVGFSFTFFSFVATLRVEDQLNTI